jgi:nucleoside permease NupC
MGTKVVVNEFVAFSMLGPLKGHIAERSFTIATFALCGFANFSSIGIQIGGIGALAPTRKQDLARLGFRALIAGHVSQLPGGGDCRAAAGVKFGFRILETRERRPLDGRFFLRSS